MQSTLNKSISFVAVALCLPLNLLAHPGHEGHGVASSLPLTSQDYLAALAIVVGVWGVRSLWRSVRQGRR